MKKINIPPSAEEDDNHQSEMNEVHKIMNVYKCIFMKGRNKDEATCKRWKTGFTNLIKRRMIFHLVAHAK